jgi:aminoglycoside phosphotransferase
MTYENNENRPQLPNKAFDSEYATQFRKEMEYLKSRGIECTYVKRTGEYRIPTYKYTKTPELFRAVADFYEQHNNEKMFNTLATALRTAHEINVWASPLSN